MRLWRMCIFFCFLVYVSDLPGQQVSVVKLGSAEELGFFTPNLVHYDTLGEKGHHILIRNRRTKPGIKRFVSIHIEKEDHRITYIGTAHDSLVEIIKSRGQKKRRGLGEDQPIIQMWPEDIQGFQTIREQNYSDRHHGGQGSYFASLMQNSRNKEIWRIQVNDASNHNVFSRDHVLEVADVKVDTILCYPGYNVCAVLSNDTVSSFIKSFPGADYAFRCSPQVSQVPSVSYAFSDYVHHDSLDYFVFRDHHASCIHITSFCKGVPVNHYIYESGAEGKKVNFKGFPIRNDRDRLMGVLVMEGAEMSEVGFLIGMEGGNFKHLQVPEIRITHHDSNDSNPKFLQAGNNFAWLVPGRDQYADTQIVNYYLIVVQFD